MRFLSFLRLLLWSGVSPLLKSLFRPLPVHGYVKNVPYGLRFDLNCVHSGGTKALADYPVPEAPTSPTKNGPVCFHTRPFLLMTEETSRD